MDIKDLAPALLAIADTLEEANLVLNGNRAQVRVQVHASFKTGSFGVDLDVAQKFISHALDFLANDVRVVGSMNLLTILGFIGGGSAGLVKLVRWLRGRTIRKVEISDENGVATVITDDGSLEVEAKTIELFRSYKVRQSIERAIKLPLEREGIESVAFVYEERVTEVIERHERHYFAAPTSDKLPIDEQEYLTSLQLVSVPMREGYKWRVDDGNGPFTAVVLDEAFVQKMQRSEITFTAGDILVARIRKRQFLSAGELRSEHEILEVVRHDSAFRQIPLPITRRDE